MEDKNMDLKVLLTTFGMIFLAELGDKTQLATFSFAAESKSPLAVFLGSAGALVLTSLLAVILGAGVSRLIPANYIKTGAGVLFILLGLWMVLVPGGK
jgi:putative Ca2+/H+ antiporter (TMEM165/GDT1 family)